jgi:hypothetical protein
MKPVSIFVCAIVVALGGANAAHAQTTISPGGSQFSPPVPAPPPPPKISVPIVPQMNAPMQQNYAPAPRSSFGDRIQTCLDEGAATGLGANQRSAYSRSCAN